MGPKTSQDSEPQIIYKWSLATRSPLPCSAEHCSNPCSGDQVSAWAGAGCVTGVPVDLSPKKRVPEMDWLREASGASSGNIQGIQKPEVACSRVGQKGLVRN